MKLSPRLNIIAGILLAALFYSINGIAQVTQPIFSYPVDPDAVVISYVASPQMLGDPDLTPRVQLFGDGWVKIHYPDYMKRAGEYELQLTPEEIQQLLTVISAIFDFDQRAVLNQRELLKQQNRKSSKLSNYRSDSMFEQIEVNLDSYQSNANAIPRPVKLQLGWQDISVDAGQYPTILPLQKLAAARIVIRSLLQRNDLLRVEDTDSGEHK